MAERNQPIVLPLGSVGFATDMPAQVRQLSHYTLAQNVIYELDGSIRKVGGDSRINATAITDGPSITGMFDYWKAGTSGSFAQKFVAMTSNNKIWKDDMDGVFDEITGAASITAGAIPVFCQARDLLLIANDKNDTPLKWNQTGNVASLGGTPPTGRGFIFHANRAWAWGVNANPSRLYYSSSTDVEDWSGADTGSFDLDPEDGDRIIGAASYKKNLFLFKGPNKGSIHVIGGTAPTGADAFNRSVLVRGIALQSHNSILPEVTDDVWFMSDQGVHSLSATNQYGNFAGGFLSRFLQRYFRSTVNRARFNQVWGVHYAMKGSALWVLPVNGSTTNNATLGVSYARIKEDMLKWFTWSRGGISAAIRIAPTTLSKDIVFGSSAGFALLEDQTARSITPSTAYNYQLTTPWISTGEIDSAGQAKPYNPATLVRLAMQSISVGNYNVNVNITTDMGDTNAVSLPQGTGFTSATGCVFGSAIFGQQVFGGTEATRNAQFGFAPLSGEGRMMKIDITQGGLNEDAHLDELAIEKTPSAYSEVA